MVVISFVGFLVCFCRNEEMEEQEHETEERTVEMKNGWRWTSKLVGAS